MFRSISTRAEVRFKELIGRGMVWAEAAPCPLRARGARPVDAFASWRAAVTIPS